MSGYWAIGSPGITAAPTRMMRIAMTIAITGRATKNFPMARHLGEGAVDALGVGAADPAGCGAVTPRPPEGAGGVAFSISVGAVSIGKADVSAGFAITACPARTFPMP